MGFMVGCSLEEGNEGSRTGQGKEQSEDVVSAGVSCGLMPWELWDRNCTTVVPHLKAPSWSFVFPLPTTTGQGLGAGATQPPWQPPLSWAPFSREGGSPEMLAAHPPNSWGTDAQARQGNPGGAPTGFTAPLTLPLSPIPAMAGWGRGMKLSLLNPKLPVPLVC